MLTDVGDLHHIRIQSGTLRCLSECGFMHTRGAGTYYNSCQPFFMDGRRDLRLSRLGTHILVVFGMDNARLHLCHIYDFFYIYRCGDIASAVADKYSYPLHLDLTSYIF
jgi:hypothetical protein